MLGRIACTRNGEGGREKERERERETERRRDGETERQRWRNSNVLRNEMSVGGQMKTKYFNVAAIYFDQLIKAPRVRGMRGGNHV